MGTVLLLAIALPAAAAPGGDAGQLATTPVRQTLSPTDIVTDSKDFSRDLNAEERRYQRPPQRFELRRIASPLQRLPRGNHETALLGDQPDTVELVNVVEW